MDSVLHYEIWTLCGVKLLTLRVYRHLYISLRAESQLLGHYWYLYNPNRPASVLSWSDLHRSGLDW